MKVKILTLMIFPLFILFARDRKFDQLYEKVNIENIPIASSFLLEKGKSKKEYSGEKINDRNYDTAWCVSKNQGIRESIYLSFPNDFSYGTYDNLAINDFPISFALFNGFSKTEDLFFANNRVKRILIEFTEIPYSFATGDFTLKEDINLHGEPILNRIHEFSLIDSKELQTISFKLKSKQKIKKVIKWEF